MQNLLNATIAAPEKCIVMSFSCPDSSENVSIPGKEHWQTVCSPTVLLCMGRNTIVERK